MSDSNSNNVETVPPGESEDINTIIKISLALLEVSRTPVPRGQHGKHHGCVKAEFEVLSDIPSELRLGIFQTPRTFQAIVRFSNGSRLDDRDGDVRGMAIKLLSNEVASENHDIVLMSHPAFFSSDARSNRQLAETLASVSIHQSDRWLFWMRSGPARRAIWIALRHFLLRFRFRELIVLRRALSCKPSNSLSTDYWSATPYALQDKVVKYRAKSNVGDSASSPSPRSGDFLREAMRVTLDSTSESSDVEFEFSVQVQSDEKTMPVEDASVVWDESKSPFIPIARLRIPKQVFDTPQQMSLCEGLSFTPARAPYVHRPLGGINRVRCRTYEALSKTRHALNDASRIEPKSWSDVDVKLKELEQALSEAGQSNDRDEGNQNSQAETNAAKSTFLTLMVRAAALVFALYLLAFPIIGLLNSLFFRFNAPASAPESELLSINQGVPSDWSRNGLLWYSHASQGTMIMPYKWFLALEQPELSVPPFSGESFVDPKYLSRFGFLSSSLHDEFNPGGALPTGFAIERTFDDPKGAFSGTEVVGLTCAACHTGKLTIRKPDSSLVSLRVEGGAGVIDIRSFQEALGRSVAYTLYDPFRFRRFEDRVLGKLASSEERGELRKSLNVWWNEVLESAKASETQHIFELVPQGPGRTDALALIGNRVFGGERSSDDVENLAQSKTNENLAVANAPVNFPPLWDTSWFDWVQYNGSIRMVMVRNIGEALGVGARTNTNARSSRFLESSVNVKNLHLIEDLLGGEKPFSGLRPPRWEDAVEAVGFPPLNESLVNEGKLLYKQHCEKCHLPTTSELIDEYANENSDYWSKPELPEPFAKRFLKLRRIPLERIGTDPLQAVNFAFRTARFPDLENEDRMITLTAAGGLRLITEKIRSKAYQALTPDEKSKWDRFRKHSNDLPDDQVVEAPLAYRPRPHDGVWATPPYFHNGSVPTLRQVLSPIDDRAPVFYVGSNIYDPVNVGLELNAADDESYFKFDTRLAGNRNTGHEFRNLTLLELELAFGLQEAAPKLSVEERWSSLLGITLDDYSKISVDERARAQRVLTEAVLRVREEEDINAGERSSAYSARSLDTVRDAKITAYEQLGEKLRSSIRRKATEYSRDDRQQSKADPAVAPNIGVASFPGVIGPLLSEDERTALIEFLKSL
jgi:hypothetical protein